MDLETIDAKTVLTPQRAGFLTSGPYPFTHALSPYVGCAYGATACGTFCYAQYLPNWRVRGAGARWGERVFPKRNAAEVLDAELARLGTKRATARVFMSTTTDPYQPIEAKVLITRRCLEVFACYPDLDLLVLQTRGPLIARDFDLLGRIPYAWLSITVETDDAELFRNLRGGPPPAKRLAVARQAVAAGLRVQIAVSPCLPHGDRFADTLAGTGAARFVVDTVVDGDGSGGRRTRRSSFATVAGWDDTSAAHRLYDQLRRRGLDVGWSAAGFCGLVPRAAHRGASPETSATASLGEVAGR